VAVQSAEDEPTAVREHDHRKRRGVVPGSVEPGTG
jgi:hypothetical protein